MSDYVLVPREPTIHMVEAVREWNRSGPRAPLPIAEETNLAAVIWDLMLAAAPPAWRDIAEAPDGKAVLAWSSGVRLMRFDAKIGQWRNMLGRPKAAPSAWMPLPPPPEGRER